MLCQTGRLRQQAVGKPVISTERRIGEAAGRTTREDALSIEDSERPLV